MVLIFDLDDTLYDEKTYAYSGFKAVAKYLSHTKGLSEKKLFQEMVKIEAERGKIFDRVLAQFGMNSPGMIKKCVAVYRNHHPILKLYADVDRCLKRFSSIPLYILTDGHKLVQLQKLKSLKLWKHELIRHCYRTNAYGAMYAKPSRHCFDLIAAREKVLPEQIVYVGDNPSKDFVIKKYGFKTIRILRGHYFQVKADSDYEAHVRIKNFDELTYELLNQLGLSHEK